MKVISLLLLTLLVACGEKATGPARLNTPLASGYDDDLPLEGKYRAHIRPINTPVSGIISGVADIEVTKNVTVRLVMDDAPSGRHVQIIHEGTDCPLMADTNGDGLIDGEESTSFLPDFIMTLDQGGRYPEGRSWTTQKMVDLKKLEQSLRDRSKGLKFAGRVILIYGIDHDAPLPATVQGTEGSTPQSSFPIACGLIKRL